MLKIELDLPSDRHIREVMEAEAQKQGLQTIYWILGVGMVALPLFSALWLYLVDETGSLIFWVESFGVLVFSLYWIVKTIEINESHLEEKDKLFK